MRAHRSIAFLVLVLAVRTARAQDESAPNEMRPMGVAARLAEAFGSLDPLRDEGVGLRELAAAVEEAIKDVDRDDLIALNTDLVGLEQTERDLVSRLGDLREGLPAQPLAVEPAATPFGDCDEQTLELEHRQLSLLDEEIERLERAREAEALASAAQERARRLTPFSTALLGSFSEIPPPAEKPLTPVAAEAETEFPERMAQALFRAGDYAGALRYFRQLDEEQLTLRHRYEMARCLQEGGRSSEALKVLTKVVEEAGNGDEFWHDRAQSFARYLEKSISIEGLLKQE